MVYKDSAMTPRLIEEIYRLGYSNTELSRAMGCSQTAIKQWITGDTIPYAYYLAKLHYLGCDVIYILTGERNV